MISNIQLKSFKISLMLELFMCLWLKLLKLLKCFYSWEVNFFFQIFDPNTLAIFFVVYIFPWIYTIFSHFFFNKNCQVKKFSNQKNMLVGEGGGGVNPTI
jgi:hypothetical protein